MLVDSHCHLDRIESDQSVDELLNHARSRGVEHFLCVSVDLDQFPGMMEKIAGKENVYASCGVHPLNQEHTFERAQLLEGCSRQDIVAVGETGLDYFYAPESKALQLDAFEIHMDVAKQVNKPLIIHTRDAKQDTLSLMKKHDAGSVGGVLHCFTEDWEMASAAIDLGFYISISGIVTFRNADALRDVVRKIPMDRLLVETDSPYLAPVPYRGKTNQPAWVREVAEFIADLKEMPLDKLAAQTTQNFFDCFRIPRG